MGKLLAPQATRRRARRFEDNIKNYNATREAAEEAKLSDLLAADRERDDAMKAMVSQTVSKYGKLSRELEQYEEIFHKNFFNVMTNVMALITTESVLLDDDVNKEELYESFLEAYQYLYETDQILVANSPVFDKLAGRAVTYIGGASEVS